MDKKSGRGKAVGQRSTLKDLTPRREHELVKGGTITKISWTGSGGDRPTEPIT